jgi:hypothetical protein
MKSVSIGAVGIGHVDPAHRDGDDFRPAGLERGGVLGEVLVLAGADDQPRAEGAARHGPGVSSAEPPPTKCTISSTSPWASATSPSVERATMIPLRSTATFSGLRTEFAHQRSDGGGGGAAGFAVDGEIEGRGHVPRGIAAMQPCASSRRSEGGAR